MKKLNLTPLTFQTGDVLSRSQLKNVLGGFGRDVCVIKVTESNGYTGNKELITSNSPGSSEANSWCVSYIASHPGSRCSYDCAYDGFYH